MEQRDEEKIAPSEKGGVPSLIEKFEIVGLYGSRTVSMESDYAATILIAQNGSGKTTLLGAMNAFLRFEFGRLRDLQFAEIRCRVRGVPSELVLRRDDILKFLEPDPDGEVAQVARKANIEFSSLLNFLMVDYVGFRKRRRIQYEDSKVFRDLQRINSWNTRQTFEACEALRDGLFKRIEAIGKVTSVLQDVLKNIEIVYLPTYRRIELALPRDPDEERYGRRASPFNFGPNRLFTGNIEFGLSDVSDRLAELNEEVATNSSFGYREISAAIINELINGTYDNQKSQGIALPNKDELSLFFARLKDVSNTVRHRHDMGSSPEVELIYNKLSTGDMTKDSSEFLRYFLSKLSTVLKSTRDMELQVEEFVNNCNKYLLSHVLNQEAAGAATFISSGLEKRLHLDRKTLKVKVEGIADGRAISLDSLSSGEKQMISLFAALFLYPKTKVVLIDEPELSLSIDWQRNILVDVVNAPTCRQVIAITHSPFVFDNSLEPYAKSLKVSVDSSAASAAIDEQDPGATLG